MPSVSAWALRSPWFAVFVHHIHRFLCPRSRAGHCSGASRPATSSSFYALGFGPGFATDGRRPTAVLHLCVASQPMRLAEGTRPGCISMDLSSCKVAMDPSGAVRSKLSLGCGDAGRAEAVGGLGAGAAVVGEAGQCAQDRTGWGGGGSGQPECGRTGESGAVAAVPGVTDFGAEVEGA